MFYFKTRKIRGIYLIFISIMVSGKWIECPKLHPSSAKFFCSINHKTTDICSNLNIITNISIIKVQRFWNLPRALHFFASRDWFCITYNLLFYCLPIFFLNLAALFSIFVSYLPPMALFYSLFFQNCLFIPSFSLQYLFSLT